MTALSQQQWVLSSDCRLTSATCSTGDFTPPTTPSIRTISAEVFWTVQFLKEHDALRLRRCPREECGRQFVDLNGRTKWCSEACRVANAQGR